MSHNENLAKLYVSFVVVIRRLEETVLSLFANNTSRWVALQTVCCFARKEQTNNQLGNGPDLGRGSRQQQKPPSHGASFPYNARENQSHYFIVSPPVRALGKCES